MAKKIPNSLAELSFVEINSLKLVTVFESTTKMIFLK